MLYIHRYCCKKTHLQCNCIALYKQVRLDWVGICPPKRYNTVVKDLLKGHPLQTKINFSTGHNGDERLKGAKNLKTQKKFQQMDQFSSLLHSAHKGPIRRGTYCERQNSAPRSSERVLTLAPGQRSFVTPNILIWRRNEFDWSPRKSLESLL